MSGMKKKKLAQALAAAVLLTGVAASGVPASQAVTSQGSQTTAVSSVHRPIYRWQYLVSKPVGYNNGWTINVPVDINSRTYIKSMWGRGTRIEFNLARKCKELRTTIGMEDGLEPTGDLMLVTITKLPSQRVVWERVVGDTSAIPVRLNMRGAYRVRIESEGVVVDGFPNAGIGSPRVLCRIR